MVSSLSESQLHEVYGCYCESARADGSGDWNESEIRQMKEAERHDKESVRTGKARGQGKASENFRIVGDSKNATADL